MFQRTAMTTWTVDEAAACDVRVKTDGLFAIALAGLFVLVYTQGYIERIGVPLSMVKMAIELPVFAILIHLINRGVWQRTPGLSFIVLYGVWTAVSAIYNGDGMGSAFLHGRYVIYAYIVFAAVWNTPLTKTTVMRINAMIAMLFLLQIAASAFEVFVRNVRIEAHVGTLYADGGALATEFPLLAMGLTVPFFLFCGGNPVFLVIAWAFFLVGYASGKRAIYFLGPCLYFFIFLWYAVRVRAASVPRRLLVGALVFVCLLPGILLGMSRSHGIAQDYARGPLERIVNAVQAAADYTMTEKQAGRTTGRTATNRRVLSMLWTVPPETVLFGWGPSSRREGQQERYERLMITYGICGWSRDVICIGWPGMLIYLLFHFRLFACLQQSAPLGRSGYWAALRFGAEIVFFVILGAYLSYSYSFCTGGQLAYVYFYLLALLMSPQHRHLIQSEA